jgi:hypothetical protein
LLLDSSHLWQDGVPRSSGNYSEWLLLRRCHYYFCWSITDVSQSNLAFRLFLNRLKHSFKSYYFWIPIIACHLGGVIGCWVYRLFIELHWPDKDEDPQESKTRVFDVSSRSLDSYHHRDCPVVSARHFHHSRPVDGVAFRSACSFDSPSTKTFNLKGQAWGWRLKLSFCKSRFTFLFMYLHFVWDNKCANWCAWNLRKDVWQLSAFVYVKSRECKTLDSCRYLRAKQQQK